jgi:hypothetical protein
VAVVDVSREVFGGMRRRARMPRVAGLLAAEHTAFLGGCGPGNTNFFYLYFIHFAKLYHRFEIYRIGFFLFIFYSFCKIISPFRNLSNLTTKRRDARRPSWATAVEI